MRPILACLALLAACTPQPQVSDYDRCAGYGWTPGTDAFAQCMQTADQQRRAILGNYLTMQAARPQPAPVQVPFYPMQQHPTLTCQRVGNFTYCD